MNDPTADANAALIRSAYEAFSRGDIAGAMAAFADDILWHVPGRGPLSRVYRGRDVLCTESASRGDRAWSSPQVHVWTVRGRKATVFHQFQGDQQTEDEFWARLVHDQPDEDAFWASPA